jgi:hypothetical protein
MNVGMLWFDAERGDGLTTKVDRAASYYKEKYGRSPNVCYIHPGMRQENPEEKLQDLVIKTSKAVLPDHFWLGIVEAED